MSALPGCRRRSRCRDRAEPGSRRDTFSSFGLIGRGLQRSSPTTPAPDAQPLRTSTSTASAPVGETTNGFTSTAATADPSSAASTETAHTASTSASTSAAAPPRTPSSTEAQPQSVDQPGRPPSVQRRQADRSVGQHLDEQAPRAHHHERSEQRVVGHARAPSRRPASAPSRRPTPAGRAGWPGRRTPRQPAPRRPARGRRRPRRTCAPRPRRS